MSALLPLPVFRPQAVASWMICPDGGELPTSRTARVPALGLSCPSVLCAASPESLAPLTYGVLRGRTVGWARVSWCDCTLTWGSAAECRPSNVETRRPGPFPGSPGHTRCNSSSLPSLLPTTATATQPLFFSSLLLLLPPPLPLPSLPVPCLLSLTPPKRSSNARSSPLETHGTIVQTLPPE